LAVELRVVDTCSGLPNCLAPFNRFDVLEEDLWSEKRVRRFKSGDRKQYAVVKTRLDISRFLCSLIALLIDAEFCF
jgi:hypothetical protein